MLNPVASLVGYARLDTAQSFTAAQTDLIAGIGTTSTDGHILSNSTAAAAGAQQYSPRLRMTGHGWKTTATAASQQCDWIGEVRTIQGSTAPHTLYTWSAQVNAGGYTPLFGLYRDGTNAPGSTDTAYLYCSSGGGRGLFLSGSMSLVVGTSGTATSPTVATDGGTLIGAGNVSVRGDVGYFAFATGTDPATKNTSIYKAGAGVIAVGTGAASGGGIVEFKQIASGGTPATNSARIYAKDVAGNAEIFVQDEAGTETQISPHSWDAPAHFYDVADEFPYVTKEVNYYIGKIRYINHSRQARAMQQLFASNITLNQIQALPANDRRVVLAETFAEYNARTGATLAVRVWATVQNQHQSAYDAARTEEVAAHAAWVAGGSQGPEPTVRPVADIRKPKPAWIAARGG